MRCVALKLFPAIGSLLLWPAVMDAAEPADGLAELRARLDGGARPVRVVCFGDSITGIYYHTGSRRAYPELVEMALKRTYPAAEISVVNAGISGHTTRDALDRIQTDVLDKSPDLVTVNFGMNDTLRVPLDAFQRNLIQIIERSRSAGAQVLLCTPNSIAKTAPQRVQKIAGYVTAIRTVAADRNVPLADCYRRFEEIRRASSREWSLVMSDAIHPNMDGHRRLAEEIVQTVCGRSVSLDDVEPLVPAIPNTLEMLAAKKPVRVLATPPFDRLIGSALIELDPSARVVVTRWPTEGQTLGQLEQAAKTLRGQDVDLVLIGLPPTVRSVAEPELIRGLGSLMNASLGYESYTHDCVVVHPAVVDGPASGSSEGRDGLIRRLVRAQDLSLIDRRKGDMSAVDEILARWLKQQAAAAADEPQASRVNR